MSDMHHNYPFKILYYANYWFITQNPTTWVFGKGTGEASFWNVYWAVTKHVVCQAVSQIPDQLMLNVLLSQSENKCKDRFLAQIYCKICP